MQVIGFDSFEGLPEDWREGFPKGSFSDVPPVPTPENATLVPGWFEDTLPTFPLPEKVTLVHVDCDLYSSTKTVLDALLPIMREGLVLVFDEYHGYDGWENHEAKAWQEFTRQHRIVYETIIEGEQERAVQISFVGGEL